MPNPRLVHHPADLATTQHLLQQPDSAPLIIGTRPNELFDFPATNAIDSRAPELTQITRTGDTLHLGGLVTLEALIANPFTPHLLAQAAHVSAHSTLRNAATLAGVLAEKVGFPEIELALLALDAVVHRLSAVVNRVDIPLRPTHTALERLARAPRDLPIAAVAGALELDGGTCLHARIAIATGGAAMRVENAEDLLIDNTLTPELIERVAQTVQAAANPPSDLRATAEYRKAMIAVLTRRALSNLH